MSVEEFFVKLAKDMHVRHYLILQELEKAPNDKQKMTLLLKAKYFDDFQIIMDYLSKKIDSLPLETLFLHPGVNVTDQQVIGKKLPIQRRKGQQMTKIVVCGDGAVGKTALRRRFFGEAFNNNYLQTIGADFSTGFVEIDFGIGGPIPMKLQIWDLAGQQRFNSVRESFYRGSHGALMVYDVTRAPSFNNIFNWIVECWVNAGWPIPIVLLGNKQDLEENRMVEEESVMKIAKIMSDATLRNLGFHTLYLPVSAKAGSNVGEAFSGVAFSIIEWEENRKLRKK